MVEHTKPQYECRRSPNDTTPRPLVFDAARSALDVPYALKHKLLVLCGRIADDDQVVVDTSGLSDVEGSTAAYVVLPSLVGRTEKKTNAFTTVFPDRRNDAAGFHTGTR